MPLLHDYLVQSARRLPDKVALVCAGNRLTYAEIEGRANALANHLATAGVSPGDRVVVLAGNTAETVISFWAVLKANAVVCLVNPLTKSGKLQRILDDCRAAALIADQGLHSVFREPVLRFASLRRSIIYGSVDDAKLAGLPNAVRWDDALASGDSAAPPMSCSTEHDLAALIYTSGSTGEPKGVMLTHRNMMAACTSVASYLELREDDVLLNVLPFAFSYGLYQLIMAFHVGARLVLERSFTFPAEILKRIEDEQVTGFAGVPTIFSTLHQLELPGAFDLSSVRFVTSAAAALPVKHIAFLKRLFPKTRIYSMYGLTECKRCTYLPPEDLDRKPTSIGIAIPNSEVWIVDEDDRRAGPGVVGQLVVRGPHVMKGYWEKPEATAKMLRPGALPGERVLYTGDLCRMDEDGYFYFVGRMDDIIKSRGEKIAPKEVENALLAVEGVKEAAVIGTPDEVLGQAVKAFVIPEGGVTLNETELKKECQRRLESFMVPKYIAIVESLPRTDTGKIKKIELF